MNIAIITGNIGTKTEELKLKSFSGKTKTNKDDVFMNFTVATNNRWTDKDGTTQTKTTWHNVQAVRGTAVAIAKNLKQGDKVTVQGEMRNNDYTDKDGIKRYFHFIKANRVDFFLPRKDNQDVIIDGVPMEEDVSAKEMVVEGHLEKFSTDVEGQYVDGRNSQ